MAERQRGLGRGLAALLGEADAAAVEATGVAAPAPAGVREIPIELIRRNADQPRRTFDEAELEELASSVRERGVLQPILVRPAPGADGEYQIVAGERRWRAAQRAGMRAVPAVVRTLDDIEVLEIGIIENVQRADLNPLEEAQAYRALIDRFGRTQDAVAQTVGKSRSHVANALRLLALPQTVREHLAAGRLSAGHARAIAAAPDPERLAQRIVERGLSVRDAEALARESVRSPSPDAPARAPSIPKRSPDTAALESDLSDLLGLKVEILDRRGRGEVRVHYGSLEQLDEVCRRLSGG